MFRMYGKKVELIRYQVKHIEGDREAIENCISDEHKDLIEQNLSERGIEFTTVPIDQTGNEWINGMEFNSYAEALERFDKGEGYQSIDELKKQLAATDYQIIKCYEYQLAGVELPYDIATLHTERQGIRDRINDMESEDI